MPGQLRMLNGFARRDPELYLLAGAVSFAVAGMGYWFGRSAGTAEQFGQQDGRVGLPWASHPKIQTQKYEDSAKNKLEDGATVARNRSNNLKDKSTAMMQKTEDMADDAYNKSSKMATDAYNRSNSAVGRAVDKTNAAVDNGLEKAAETTQSWADRWSGKK
ncbi:hypothetical protein V1512DRAFT_245339 [Lipomyces arxii]|uniref:uncharacterized protein n=1 Tax=Lipomyces arxii TaxID=56418 RepID=UPI0034CEA334